MVNFPHVGANKGAFTAITNPEVIGKTVNVSLISPGGHIYEEVRRVFYGEAKGESLNIRI